MSAPAGRLVVGRGRAIAAIAVNLALVLVGGGSLFGYNALRPVLIRDGAFRELCPESPALDPSGCTEQKLALNLMESATFIGANTILLPSGLLMDYFGMRTLCITVTVFYAIGYTMLFIATNMDVKNGNLYLVSLVIIGTTPACSFLTALGSAKMLQDTNVTHFITSATALVYEVSPVFIYLLKVLVPEVLSFKQGVLILGIATCILSLCLCFLHLNVEETKQIDRYLMSTESGEVKSNQSDKNIRVCPKQDYIYSVKGNASGSNLNNIRVQPNLTQTDATRFGVSEFSQNQVIAVSLTVQNKGNDYLHKSCLSASDHANSSNSKLLHGRSSSLGCYHALDSGEPCKQFDQIQDGRTSDDAWSHIFHIRYILLIAFMFVVNTKNQFYIATFSDQIEYATSRRAEAALPFLEKLPGTETVNQWFDIGTFVSPIVTTPFLIIFLERYHNRFDLVFFYLWVLTIFHAFLNTWGKDSIVAQAVAMMIFFILRPLKWAACCEFLHHSPYKLDQYGRLYGVLSVACAFGALCLYPLTWMSYFAFEGSFFNANLILSVCEASVVVLPLYLHFKEYIIQENDQEYASPRMDNKFSQSCHLIHGYDHRCKRMHCFNEITQGVRSDLIEFSNWSELSGATRHQIAKKNQFAERSDDKKGFDYAHFSSEGSISRLRSSTADDIHQPLHREREH